MKVLIVEDNKVSRLLLQKVLQNDGHEVVAVADGLVAWETFDRNPFRVVISDWMMPSLDGLALCAKIRSRPHTAYTYFILLTALDDTRENMRKAMETGVDDFLRKPLNTDMIWARLLVAERILHYTNQIRQLRDLLPICMYCKRIRDDRDYWQQIESYISTETGVDFSHGICPECYQTRVLPQLRDMEHDNGG